MPQDPAVAAVPTPVTEPLRHEQVPPWKSQHPVDAPLAGNWFPHRVWQAAGLTAVAVATVLPPQPVPLATTHVSGITKVAVTFTSAVTETRQVVLVPVQPPDQLANADPVGVAVRVTLPLPGVNRSEQTAPQLMFPESDATVPVPFPALSTVSANCPALQLPPGDEPPPGIRVPFRQKQRPLPLRTQHPPLIPAAAMAVSHPSWQPCAFSAVPRSRSTGVVVSVAQFASDAVVTVVHPSGAANVAVTAVAAAIDTVQVVLVPKQAPDQPTNADPLAAAAVSVTLVP